MTSKSNVQRASRPRPCAGQRLVVRIALLISLSLAAAITRSVEAQTSALQGTVSVSSAGGQSERLPGANLSLTPAADGQAALSAVTDEQGEFKFTNLAAGLYTLRVSLGGFRQHAESVTIRVGVTTHADVALEVEGVSDNVTVVAEGDGLNATDAAPAA